MSFFNKTVAKIGSLIGKTALYAVAAAGAFLTAVVATPYRNESRDVITGSLTFLPGDTSVSGGMFVHVPIPDELLTEPADVVSIPDAEMAFVDYTLAVPERHAVANHAMFLTVDDVRKLPTVVPPNEIRRENLDELPFYRYTYFVWLENGAIPSNAIPSNSNPNVGSVAPLSLFNRHYHSAIPSNLWGMIYAIPSNLTRNELINVYGADPSKVPSDQAIPSNLTVEILESYGIPVSSPAIPSNAIPSNAIPSNAIPSNAIPSSAIPSNLVRSNQIPAVLLAGANLSLIPEPNLLSVLEAFDPGNVIAQPLNATDAILDFSNLSTFRQPPINQLLKYSTCGGPCTRSGTISADPELLELGEDLVSSLWDDAVGVETVYGSNEGNWTNMICSSCETVALPYRTGREQAPDVGVETVSIGPQVGVEVVQIGEIEYVCTEDLTGTYAWIGHKYTGDFAVQLYLAEGQSFQSEAYQLSIDNQLFADCAIDVENPTILHCNREAIYPDRWVEFALTAQPSTCEVWGGTYYVCPAGETYHGANMWWDGGCCTTSCWCIDPDHPTDTVPGCWMNCPGCPP